ncbi:iron complex outermembrane receptor protein [Sphingomonas zeicaulis]|uniref:TonB-dependent receptor n=1 Tax=Sphingomonas zeicaulis TaxID=1632740 RepID=UPI003D229624
MLSIRSGSAIPALAALLLAGTAMPAFAQHAEDESGGDIVVTAQKREQTLLEVNAAVQAIGGDQLREDGVKSFVDLSQHTPGVIVTTPLVGGSTVQNFTIRGIGFDDFRPNGNPSAAVHFDGIYQGSSALIGGQMFDVQRVEVLKGPQGTLYGRNTTAGAVNVISNKPSTHVEGLAFVDYGSFNTLRAEGAVNVPFSQTIALRVSGLYDRTDGFLTRLGANGLGGTTPVPGVIPPIIDPGRSDEAAGVDFYGARALLSIGMNGPTELLFNVHAFKDDGGQGQSERANLGLPPRSYYSNLDARRKRKSWGASVTLNQEIGDSAMLTALAGYEFLDSDYDWDDGQPTRTFDIDYKDKIHQGSVEVRLQNRDAGNFNWTVGGAYFRDSVDLYSILDGSDTYRTIFEADYKQNRESFAGFANVDVLVAPRLRVEAGIRLTHETGRFDGSTLDLDPYGLTVAGRVFDLPAIFDNRMKETSPSGRATISYELSDSARAYASIGRGFRAGGFDGTTIWSAPEANAFDSEEVWAYEAGVKFLPRGGPVQIEAAAFYYDFSNIQAGSTVVYDGASTAVRTNVGKARSYGAELSVRAKPVRNLDLDLGVALLDTEILEIETGTEAERLRRVGSDLPFAPNMTINGMIRYELPLSERVSLIPQVNARFVSTYYGNLDNNSEAGDFTLVNARVDLRLDKRWSIAGFVRNLTDTVYSTGASNVARISGAPRTWGVSVGARF